MTDACRHATRKNLLPAFILHAASNAHHRHTVCLQPFSKRKASPGFFQDSVSSPERRSIQVVLLRRCRLSASAVSIRESIGCRGWRQVCRKSDMPITRFLDCKGPVGYWPTVSRQIKSYDNLVRACQGICLLPRDGPFANDC